MSNQLIEFLDNLKCNIEQNNISDEELELVGQFYMKYEFISNNKKHEDKTHDEDNANKYFVLGWYIYNIIMKNF